MKANWERLNQKVLSKISTDLKFQISPEHIGGIIFAKFGFAERTILQIKKIVMHFSKQNNDLYDDVIMEPFDEDDPNNNYRH